MKDKCSFRIQTSKSRTRCCKGNVFIIINNKKYCWCHSKLVYNNFIIKIQKIYKGYIKRKKLKNLYKNLPEDIQKKIINYIRQDYYTFKYNNSVIKILKNKIYIIDHLLETTIHLIRNTDLFIDFDNEFLLINKLITIYEFILKNFNIIKNLNSEDINNILIKLYMSAKWNNWIYHEEKIIFSTLDLFYVNHNFTHFERYVNLLHNYNNIFERNYHYPFSLRRINNLITIQ